MSSQQHQQDHQPLPTPTPSKGMGSADSLDRMGQEVAGYNSSNGASDYGRQHSSGDYNHTPNGMANGNIPQDGPNGPQYHFIQIPPSDLGNSSGSSGGAPGGYGLPPGVGPGGYNGFSPANNFRSRIHNLILRQQPKHSRMCGFGEKVDRRPVDPPPIVQLEIKMPPESDESSYLFNPYYFMYATLMAPDIDDELHLLRDGKTRSTTGSIVSSLYRLKDINNKEGAFFVFPDLSVRLEGSYRLKFSLFEIVNTEIHFCKSVISDVFHVYAAKKFPGMEESTFLSKLFAEQGLKIRIRKESRGKGSKNKRGGSDEDSPPLKSRARNSDSEGEDKSGDEKQVAKRPNSEVQHDRKPSMPEPTPQPPPHPQTFQLSPAGAYPGQVPSPSREYPPHPSHYGYSRPPPNMYPPGAYPPSSHDPRMMAYRGPEPPGHYPPGPPPPQGPPRSHYEGGPWGGYPYSRPPGMPGGPGHGSYLPRYDMPPFAPQGVRAPAPHPHHHQGSEYGGTEGQPPASQYRSSQPPSVDGGPGGYLHMQSGGPLPPPPQQHPGYHHPSAYGPPGSYPSPYLPPSHSGDPYYQPPHRGGPPPQANHLPPLHAMQQPDGRNQYSPQRPGGYVSHPQGGPLPPPPPSSSGGSLPPPPPSSMGGHPHYPQGPMPPMQGGPGGPGGPPPPPPGNVGGDYRASSSQRGDHYRLPPPPMQSSSGGHPMYMQQQPPPMSSPMSRPTDEYHGGPPPPPSQQQQQQQQPPHSQGPYPGGPRPAEFALSAEGGIEKEDAVKRE